MNKKEAELFISNNTHALSHLFMAIDEYNNLLTDMKNKIDDINRNMDFSHDMYVHVDQWSHNANYHHAKYIERNREMEKRLDAIKKEFISSSLKNIGSTLESMATLAGSVLQISKQLLSISHSVKPKIPDARLIGSQSIIEVIWEGRNHSMHWEEDDPKRNVKKMLEVLSQDFNIDIKSCSNNSLTILSIMGWKSTDDVVGDLLKLI